MIGGDFNEIVDKIEKWRGKKSNQKKARHYLNFTETWRLFDLARIC